MTKNHETIEEALEYLRSKNPSIEQRAEKYFQQLQEIDFSTIEEGKFSEFLTKHDDQKGQAKKKERELINPNIEKTLEMKEPCKGADVANMRTEATYGAQIKEYQVPFSMA